MEIYIKNRELKVEISKEHLKILFKQKTFKW